MIGGIVGEQDRLRLDQRPETLDRFGDPASTRTRDLLLRRLSGYILPGFTLDLPRDEISSVPTFTLIYSVLPNKLGENWGKPFSAYSVIPPD